MRLAMFGGTFDPIHNGHIMLGESFADLLGLDRVMMVPTRTPPHKAATTTPGSMRLEMCRLAAEEMGGRFGVCDFEQRREGRSYSYYTVCYLRAAYQCEELFLITGADMFLTLETWHRFDELKGKVTFCTVPRDDAGVEELNGHARHLESIGCRTVVADIPPYDMSSTAIREAVRAGRPITGMTLPSVERYIHEHGLYTN